MAWRFGVRTGLSVKVKEKGEGGRTTRRTANNIHKGLLSLIHFEEFIRSNKDAM